MAVAVSSLSLSVSDEYLRRLLTMIPLRLEERWVQEGGRGSIVVATERAGDLKMTSWTKASV